MVVVLGFDRGNKDRHEKAPGGSRIPSYASLRGARLARIILQYPHAVG